MRAISQNCRQIKNGGLNAMMQLQDFGYSETLFTVASELGTTITLFGGN